MTKDCECGSAGGFWELESMAAISFVLKSVTLHNMKYVFSVLLLLIRYNSMLSICVCLLFPFPISPESVILTVTIYITPLQHKYHSSSKYKRLHYFISNKYKPTTHLCLLNYKLTLKAKIEPSTNQLLQSPACTLVPLSILLFAVSLSLFLPVIYILFIILFVSCLDSPCTSTGQSRPFFKKKSIPASPPPDCY